MVCINTDEGKRIGMDQFLLETLNQQREDFCSLMRRLEDRCCETTRFYA